MADAQQQHLKIRQDGPVTRIAFADAELTDELAIEEIGQYLTRLVQEAPNGKVVLDFAGVTRCISRMFGVLAAFQHKAGAAGMQLRLCGLDANFHEAFTITRLDSRLRICATYEAAVKSFK